MTRAYHTIYLNNVQTALGDAFDYAVHECCISGEAFAAMFVASPVSRRMQNGEPAYISGKSGIEIAREVIASATGQEPDTGAQGSYGRSAAYWIGWAVAYYQWTSGRSYRDIFGAVSYAELEQMYVTQHEADISRFVDAMDARMRECYQETNLKRIRTAYGCSQAELAERSGVGLRSIQMYEQRNKNINKAGADTLLRMARVLGCSMEALMEPERPG